MNTKWNKNIEFLGTAEFASRWRRELTPGTVSTGKTISRFISNDVKAGRGKNIQDEAISFIKKYSSDEKKVLQNQPNKRVPYNSKKSENTDKKERQPRAKRKISKPKSSSNKFAKNYLKKDIPDPWKTPIKSLDERKKELFNNINKGIDEAQQKRASQPPRPKPNFKYKPLPKREGVVKLVGKSILKNKGKLALLAGAGTLGAVGYGLIRKARSDKGKKRRFYNR